MSILLSFGPFLATYTRTSSLSPVFRTYAEDGSVRGPSARLRRLMMDADDEESDGDKR